jgi:hypothetical protein
MATGDTLFERVVESERSASGMRPPYQSLVTFYALADARFKASWRIVDGTYFPDQRASSERRGEVMVLWQRYIGEEDDEEDEGAVDAHPSRAG